MRKKSSEGFGEEGGGVCESNVSGISSPLDLDHRSIRLSEGYGECRIRKTHSKHYHTGVLCTPQIMKRRFSAERSLGILVFLVRESLEKSGNSIYMKS